ncbi:MAG TPA: beta-L-arabinofuranosidase domain-containing protein, partial [Propionibacteriaceae bacterium]|nr:beta-L-arabinofuranosidase domain-containing protein [Propionibacteriaceae bacterium]
MSTPPQHGPVRVTEASRVAFQPATRATITGGFWAERRRVNRDVTVPSTWHRLHQAGNIANLEAAAGLAGDEYVHTVTFFDSDVYKWLEAVGWMLADPLLGEETATDLADYLDRSFTLLSQAQAQDGYLNSYYQ